ncbi:hypothetical protein V502_05134 [Pseudogymnoascus sp. VKM F-4520 (FW-2644)]|nr:hypothetical protein V502_05134 [Pseudogymnoascus sp. VKM F-4520 (FW-2644)]
MDPNKVTSPNKSQNSTRNAPTTSLRTAPLIKKPGNGLDRSSAPLIRLARKPKLKPIAQRAHIRVRVLEQLKGVGDDLDGPGVELGVLPALEAQVEVARVLGVDAEGVDGALGVGLGVGR